MACPFCRTEMRRGRLSSNGLIRSTEKHRVSLDPGPDEQYAPAVPEASYQP